MQETGFLGTAAPRAADLTLLLEMGMGTGLLAGAWLARVGRIRFHAICQSVIVLLNLGLIVLTMFPAFHRQVLPKLPGRIGRPYYPSRSLMPPWAELLSLGAYTYCWRPGRSSFRRNSELLASDSG